jgi:putative peptidoglycan lipid II flippase
LYGVAYGAVIGAALHLLVQVPGLFLFKARWTPAFGLKDPELWRILRLMVPRTIELGMFSISFLVMTNIASRLGTGSVSALDWGWRLMQIPQTLIGTAMGVVIFPTLAALSQLGDVDGKRGAFSGALRFILIGSIPSAIGLILVGRPLISLLEGGAFDAAASDLVYSTLAMFSLGIVVHSILEVVARGFYADKDMLTPLWVAVGGAVINVGLAVVLSGVLSDTPDSEGFPAGLALANSLAVTFEVVVLMGVLRRRWRGLDENSLGVTALKTTAASLVMGVAVFAVGWVWALLGLTERGTLLTLAMIGAQVAVGAVVFVGAAYALKLNELRDLLTALSRRFSRQPREVNA